MRSRSKRVCFPYQALLAWLLRHKHLTMVAMMLINGIVIFAIIKTSSFHHIARILQMFTKAEPIKLFSFPEVNESHVIEGEEHYLENFDNVSAITIDNTTLDDDDQRLAFSMALTPYERETLLFVFQAFVRACNKHNVLYFLYGGTLLGSVRHHDIIPWDDDIDVILNELDKPKLLQALNESVGDFRAYLNHYGVVKFYWLKGKPIRDLPYLWPFIDIFFYTENTTHIYDALIEFSEFSYRKTSVFPLCHRPFAGSLLPVPRFSLSTVLKTYSLSQCASLSYRHKFESSISHVHKVPCDQLHQVYPFTRRTVKHGLSKELLVKDGQTLSEFNVPETCGEYYNQEQYNDYL